VHNDESEDDRLDSGRETDKIFDISRSTRYQWIKEGKLRPIKVGKRSKFSHRANQKLLRQIIRGGAR
jgi:hypothetical protein